LRVKDVIIAVNKMDLVDYSQEKFEAIKTEIEQLSKKSGYTNQNLTFIPISALNGDNVVTPSTKIDWYKGETLLEHLEKTEAQDVFEKGKVRFPVQSVIRPKIEKYHDFRGY